MAEIKNDFHTSANNSGAVVSCDASTRESTRSSRCAVGTSGSTVVRSPTHSRAVVHGRASLPVPAVPSVAGTGVGSRAGVGAS